MFKYSFRVPRAPQPPRSDSRKPSFVRGLLKEFPAGALPQHSQGPHAVFCAPVEEDIVTRIVQESRPSTLRNMGSRITNHESLCGACLAGVSVWMNKQNAKHLKRAETGRCGAGVRVGAFSGLLEIAWQIIWCNALLIVWLSCAHDGIPLPFDLVQDQCRIETGSYCYSSCCCEYAPLTIVVTA